MSRRSNGLVAVWAEAQRQQQRRQEAQRRAGEQARRDQERQQRDTERAMARMQRERQAAYRRQREADARRRTEELEARMAELSGLLADGCRALAFTPAALRRPEHVEPFAPGRLAVPVPMPDPSAYQPQGGGWGLGGGRRAQEEARARYEHDWHAAQAAEAQRLRQLEDYRRQYDQWAAGQLAEIRSHNAAVEDLLRGLRDGDPEAVVEYFSAALYATGRPQGFPRRVRAAYDPAARQLVLDWELPGFDIVPEAKAVRYMYAADQDKDVARPVTQRRTAYRDVLAQSVLLVLHDLFAADTSGALDSVTVNGFVDDVDPATGRPAQIFLATVSAPRTAFEQLHLAQVSAVECLTDGLRGQLSARPDQRAAVRPVRQPGDVGGGVVTHGGEDEPDLFAMDPIAFEGLVAELFRAMGMQAVTTQRSGDGGVDVDALDPDPIRGGKIIVQVKRYRNTVPPSAVRDLFGTVQSEGANKGVLVTTSRFGPGAHAFANGKPLTLVGGPELVDLLARHGLRGRLGNAAVPAQRPAPAEESAERTPEPPEEDGAAGNILGMNWSGSVALDVCALVCQGNRVLSDDHFVFYNNPRTPDGTVRMLSGFAPDRAAMQVVFEALPATADRLVLVAAIDPEADPHADLSGFTDARIRLVDESGTEQGQLEVSDGRPGETALVLGSFRRRANGDWDFVIGGKGYEGGLEALVQEYGIEVA
ncbi:MULTISPECIES: restriction endonuclease [Streptomyces]|uniref:Restriction endonuclease n=2 Tax=Streptomyces rimosus subsp. rimosus TaxID=132474 RepID=A0A8A1UZQ6_STRR1|nr:MULTISPECIES: restriction endonuclease [Streptomyces]KOG71364.1 restriction endonuclease [Kitasatospora aureofaciens]MYT46299.1 restriction endonuclease [Streptomyces sp. SID5471]KEF16798.1 restriction endonuclease [Streptomyces rimosus]KOT35680.1 restriction endonuclease [Streptomyces sp. NRRL WC-3701]KOT40267.1 restriction endonuclease [Streptomyces rimosus subsp. rimosus]